MKYKGIELVEYKTTENVIFDPPKKMLVWDNTNTECLKADVVAVIPSRKSYPVVGVRYTWQHCAEIPKEATPKLATYREVSRWLAEGKGQIQIFENIYTIISYKVSQENSLVVDFEVRKWDDTEWRKPTREYLGLEDK